MFSVQPGGGTLKLCPLIKLSTSYVILRPLLKDLGTEVSFNETLLYCVFKTNPFKSDYFVIVTYGSPYQKSV